MISPQVRKRLVIGAWSVLVGGLLWPITLILNEQSHEALKTLLQLLYFIVLTFGSGYAYHIASIIFECPSDESNQNQWSKVLYGLGKGLFGYVIVTIFVVVGKFSAEWGWLICMIGVIFGDIWMIYFLQKQDEPIKQLLALSECNRINRCALRFQGSPCLEPEVKQPHEHEPASVGKETGSLLESGKIEMDSQRDQ